MTSGRTVNPFCVCVFSGLGSRLPILSECTHFEVVCKELVLWNDLIYDVDEKWKFQFCFYFRNFCFFGFYLNTKTFKCKIQANFPPNLPYFILNHLTTKLPLLSNPIILDKEDA
jgi:hypothetical protein